MKLSEAMRLGAMLGPQLRYSGWAPKTNGTCALGSALLAIGKPSYMAIYDSAESFPIVRTSAPHPVKLGNAMHLYEVIMSLNDDHEWTREQIAEWVASIEQQQEPAKLPWRPPQPELAKAI